MTRSLFRNTRGAAAVEFALVAPLLFGTIMSVMEGGRLIWTKQVLQQTAFASARCIGLKDTGCDTETNARATAVSRAKRSGVTLQTSMISAPLTAVTCASQANMRKVTITLPYSKVVGAIIGAVPGSLQASACFPIVTT